MRFPDQNCDDPTASLFLLHNSTPSTARRLTAHRILPFARGRPTPGAPEFAAVDVVAARAGSGPTPTRRAAAVARGRRRGAPLARRHPPDEARGLDRGAGEGGGHAGGGGPPGRPRDRRRRRRRRRRPVGAQRPPSRPPGGGRRPRGRRSARAWREGLPPAAATPLPRHDRAACRRGGAPRRRNGAGRRPRTPGAAARGPRDRSDRAGASPASQRASSLDEANEQTAEQNCLFGYRQTNAYLLVRLFGQQSPNRTSICPASLLASLEGGPWKCKALIRVAAPFQGLTKNQEKDRSSVRLKRTTVN